MARQNLWKLLAACGAVVMVASVLYDVFFVGLPFQDPPPDIQTAWLARQSTAGWLFTVGSGTFLLGAAGWLVLWLRRSGRAG